MTKYIITNGHSVVNMLLEDREKTSVEVTTKEKNSIKFDTVGEAMRAASKINEVLGGTNYRVMAIEV